MENSERVLQRFRELCLALPETNETTSWGHPNFRAGKRTFCAFESIRGRPSMAFRVASAEADVLLQDERFFATPYGRGQWVSIWADGSIPWDLVEDLVRRSYRLVALKRMIATLEDG